MEGLGVEGRASLPSGYVTPMPLLRGGLAPVNLKAPSCSESLQAMNRWGWGPEEFNDSTVREFKLPRKEFPFAFDELRAQQRKGFLAGKPEIESWRNPCSQLRL